ncbi:SdpI family protein [Halorussus litoreus]|uniref:SdpI family protein n=1 Tax=Halorussus litoreus TaxID=1710536 RepID=UPI000E21E9EC|nr:SdpI family protein [Halorussus litoreus]
MSLRKSYLVGVAIVAASALASLVAAPEMPAEMATHWNAAGEVDGAMDKEIALALFPALSAVVLALLAAVPRFDPLGENVAAFREQYDSFVVVLLAFLAYVHLLVLAANAGYEFEMIQALAPAIGGLFFYVGVLLEHAEQSWFVGIRTPWTLSNEEVWNRTHERAAPLFKVAGGIAVLGALVPTYAELLVVAPILAVSLYATAYSYVAYRRVAT